MKYRATHLKTGQVSTLDSEQVRLIQENGFGAQFSFEVLSGGDKSAPPIFETEQDPDENEAEKLPKGKKAAK